MLELVERKSLFTLFVGTDDEKSWRERRQNQIPIIIMESGFEKT